jgi:hypothetical protein
MENKEISITELISLEEASKLSGLSSVHIRHLVDKKIIWEKKIGRNWVTSKEAILEYIQQNQMSVAEG